MHRALYTVLSSPTPVESTLTIKRSEFICYLNRVETEDEARAYIESLRKIYHDARHVCSAFVLGASRNIQRSSDDGEPAGTAGIPILQALLTHRTPTQGDEEADLSDICAVVVRYFGGTKLGAGGLVHAYSGSVVQTLNEAKFTYRQRLCLGTVAVPFSESGKVDNDLRIAGIQVLKTDYTPHQAEITLGVFDSFDSKQKTEKKLAELTAGKLTISWGETHWIG